MPTQSLVSHPVFSRGPIFGAEHRRRIDSAALDFDATRTDNELTLQFDLPGFDRDNIEVIVDKDVLKVTAERTFETEDDVNVLRKGRSHGQVARWLRLGDDVDGDAISAGYDDGVLTISVPVTEPETARHVAIDA